MTNDNCHNAVVIFCLILQTLTIVCMKNIKLIEVPSEIGAGTRGASLGIDAIKIAALDFMSNFFIHFPSEKIPTENKLLYEPIELPYAKRIKGIVAIYEKVSKAVADTLKNN